MRKISKKLMEEYIASKKRFEDADDEVGNVVYDLLKESGLDNWIIKEYNFDFDKDIIGVSVEEHWRYGGEDHDYFEFPLSEIFDASYLRKRKLEKINKLEETK